MKIKFITFTILLFCSVLVLAQTLNYDNPNRRILVKRSNASSADITIHNELGYWNLKGVYNPGALTGNGALQISNLGEEKVCARSYVWNSFQGEISIAPDSQTSIIAPFNLTNETKFRVSFSGVSHFRNGNDFLFLEPSFFLKSGLTGSGGTLLNITGSGYSYITLPAGNYRFSTAIGAFNNCTNNPMCDVVFTGQSELSMTQVALNSTSGESYTVPFYPDEYTVNENDVVKALNTEGALIIRGIDSTYIYQDKPDGWFDIGHDNHAQIAVQSSGIITTLQIPDNRQGTFKITVDNILLGDFIADDVIVFADYSFELGSLLLNGVGGLQGIKNIDIVYQPIEGEILINNCGQSQNTAVKLSFDEASVTFSAVLPYVHNLIFSGSFEG
jgi:hypothetical protein